MAQPTDTSSDQCQSASGASQYISAYAIYETLFFSSQNHFANCMLVVDAPEELQVIRTVARDGSSEAQARAILNAQSSRNERLEYADNVILNDKSLACFDIQVARLNEQYLQFASHA